MLQACYRNDAYLSRGCRGEATHLLGESEGRVVRAEEGALETAQWMRRMLLNHTHQQQ